MKAFSIPHALGTEAPAPDDDHIIDPSHARTERGDLRVGDGHPRVIDALSAS